MSYFVYGSDLLVLLKIIPRKKGPKPLFYSLLAMTSGINPPCYACFSSELSFPLHHDRRRPYHGRSHCPHRPCRPRRDHHHLQHVCHNSHHNKQVSCAQA
ncbi:MAG: hypothetical protein KZQ64_00970 [gamma proteobacterium symbiont of Bathyaustriella thionipta]|nr:hypothetical protein [gamma proteobacterium symbiont of Bathyaustriella thionipta]MCU7951599.1 hypothetical protein [gamma proteobacterium symbiont of Bathyaustriella thionipta]MCU7951971.1 hypothetical protein [gamma proteobacterium symbiont of Bathyaustriella thionipta]